MATARELVVLVDPVVPKSKFGGVEREDLILGHGTLVTRKGNGMIVETTMYACQNRVAAIDFMRLERKGVVRMDGRPIDTVVQTDHIEADGTRFSPIHVRR